MAIWFVSVIFSKKILTFKIGSVVSTERQGKCMKYVSFPWPLVVAALWISN